MKHITSMSGPAHTTAWAFLYDGIPAGKLIANWSKNPYGTVCSASVYIHSGPLDLKTQTGAKNLTLET